MNLISKNILSFVINIFCNEKIQKKKMQLSV